jgi:hypothetical protein
LKGLGFSRAAKSFEVVIPTRPEPRVGGEDGENLYFSDFFRSLFLAVPQATRIMAAFSR